MQMGGGANGVTNFGDIRLLKGLIYAIGCGLALAQVWSDGFFRHVTSKTSRPAFLPAYFTGDYVIRRGQYLAATGAP